MIAVRNRHQPRLCGDCGAPMARQTDECWSCGAAWAPTADTRRPLHESVAHVLETRSRRHVESIRRTRSAAADSRASKGA
jgi:uncharacterized protein (DUF2461 family)